MKSGTNRAVTARTLLAFALLILSSACVLTSYPPLWTFARKRPDDSNLVGTYVIERQNVTAQTVKGLTADRYERIVLRADHTAELSNVADFDGFGESIEQVLDGSGEWSVSGSVGDWQLTIGIHNFACQCWSVMGQRPPYRLWQNIGDPDEGQGLSFKREK